MNCDDRFCSPRKGGKSDACDRVWSHIDSSRTFTLREASPDREWSPRAHRYLSSYDLWSRETLFPTECHQWYRCRACQRSRSSYPCFSWHTNSRVYSSSGEAGNSRKWICQETSGPEGSHDGALTQWDPEARWCCRCSCYRLSHGTEGENYISPFLSFRSETEESLSPPIMRRIQENLLWRIWKGSLRDDKVK